MKDFKETSNNNKESIFIELIEKKDNFVSIHKRNLRLLANYMFKFKRDWAPAQTKETILQNKQNRHELRNNLDFTLSLMKSVHENLS